MTHIFTLWSDIILPGFSLHRSKTTPCPKMLFFPILQYAKTYSLRILFLFNLSLILQSLLFSFFPSPFLHLKKKKLNRPIPPASQVGVGGICRYIKFFI
jgi:hypothetical protein